MTDTKETELLPCPFCAGKNLYADADNPFIDTSPYYVGCQSCGSRTAQDFDTKAEAITAWNTRAPLPNKAEMLRELSTIEACMKAKSKTIEIAEKRIAELEDALTDTIGRVEIASGSYHNSQDWGEDFTADSFNGKTAWEFIKKPWEALKLDGAE